MKYKYSLKKDIQVLISVIVFTLALPFQIFGQNNNHKDIVIYVSCVEDLGDGTYLAHFGYENPNDYVVNVAKKSSYTRYNYDKSKSFVINEFQSGVYEKVFSQAFNADDQVSWTVIPSTYEERTVTATSSSEPCYVQLNIIPGYDPPVGGKVYSIIGAELNQLFEFYDEDPSGFSEVTDMIFQIRGAGTAAELLIEVVAVEDHYPAMMTLLTGLGFDVLSENSGVKQAIGWVKISDLLTLNEYFEDMRYARPRYPGVSNYTVLATGLVKSEGDFVMHSDFARLGYDVDGTGVKIGVMSNSYDSQSENTTGDSPATIDVENGDLPGIGNPNNYLLPVDVILDITPEFGSLSDEGRAMLQIVHDVAPGAELAFRTGYLGEQDMAVGIAELAAAGCDIIVDDISYLTEPFFRDGIIAQAIDDVVASGVTFFSSAGNFGKNSYTGVFTPGIAPTNVTGEAHDFGGGDVTQSVRLPEGDYTLVLQWDDGTDDGQLTTQTDLDIFLLDGSAVLGFNRENVDGFPIEVVPFSIEGDTVESEIVVARASGTGSVTFKYILFRGGEHFIQEEHIQGTSTIVGHPNAAGAIAVGAVRFDKNPIFDLLQYPEPVMMSFSSQGGTPVNGFVRNKPDITAPNGVNTTVDLGNGDWDDPIDPDTQFPNFFGTSAASPHAAGVAALILQARAIYEPSNPLDPEGIRDLLQSTTLEQLAPGEDNLAGAGFIQAHKALLDFANPSPYVENLILTSEGGVPGESLE